jgi:hypothetical protein
MAGLKMGEELHIVDVHPTIQVGKTVGSGMAVVVGPCGEG